MGACFISFAENVLPILCVVTKYQIFVRFPELFSKNLLHFASKSAILYPTRAAVGYNDCDALCPHGSCVHPSNLYCYFLHLPSYHLPCPVRDRKSASPTCMGKRFFVVVFKFSLIQPLRQCFALPPLLVGEALAVPATCSVSPEAPLPGELSSASETERLYHILRFRFAPHFLEGFPSYNLSVNASHCHLSL